MIFFKIIQNILKGIANFAISIMNTCLTFMADFWAYILNVIKGAINNINKVLGWVSDKLGLQNPISIPNFGEIDKNWRIPYLAQGAVIPPNKEFLAVLGDQTSGTNIETPVETMKQAFRDVMAEFGNNNGGEYTFVAQIDGREIFRETVRQNQLYKQRIGSNAFA